MDIGAFFSGGVNPFWPHFIFISVSILMSAAVSWGIIREAEKIWSLTTLLVVGGVAVEAICTVLLFGFDEGISDAQQRTIVITEKRLLNERRLTTRERWQMETLFRAALPRRLTAAASLVPSLRGLGPINVAIVNKREPRFFGEQVTALFTGAGIMGRVIWLPDENEHHDSTGFLGVSMYAATTRGRRVASILWQQEHIAGSVMGGGITPIGWEAIPKNEDTLIVGVNDAAWEPQSGQPGEGIDKYDRPTPVPQ